MSFLGFVIALIALFFSWQSNQISARQATPQVVILGTGYAGGTYFSGQDGWHAACKHRIRLTNLGGAATALVDYGATISYKSNQVEIGGGVSMPRKSSQVSSAVNNFQVVLLTENAPVDFPNVFDRQHWLRMPFKVDSFTTEDIDAIVSFDFDGNVQLESSAFADPASYRYAPAALAGFSPIQISFSLIMASGQRAASPTVDCWYVKG